MVPTFRKLKVWLSKTPLGYLFYTVSVTLIQIFKFFSNFRIPVNSACRPIQNIQLLVNFTVRTLLVRISKNPASPNCDAPRLTLWPNNISVKIQIIIQNMNYARLLALKSLNLILKVLFFNRFWNHRFLEVFSFAF